ncbi:MAG: hypothetical protein A2W90_16595 [Bacteroidetes bacterium GWF2_42_66]|nr:MAG: hypothetical protein A2W92_04020 [Bacteroidetes bacterium GWA2_42_15]OFX96313.1 MAG: hypothetical protein A2W89_05525 [Bacteroidetes bacterium GWE2_42_39]OFY46352.1 MAG: hypothetical protein A2W90_16595 [Bacteroidetes bacterium GWF2_42_66]HAZ03474.1 hypothetical protein [Marinilabiliales bacterium]HBL78262.1 hypothetical protein [Prolixibacteraceae bacterium]
MKKNPLVSVIMNCYNGEEYIKEAINSILAQTFQNFEIILFDNASTDKSRSIVESYEDNRIKYFWADKHVNLGTARNHAIEKAEGDYIAFLDVDDLWYPEKLFQQIPFFNDPSIGLVYCLTNSINSKSEIVNSAKFDSNQSATKISFFDLFVNYDVVLSSSIISKEALLSVNGNFDNLLEYAEEYDLFMRICSKYDAIRSNNIHASYRKHDSQCTNRYFELAIREEEYILSKFLLLFPNLFNSNIKLLEKKYEMFAWEKFLYFVSQGNAKYAREKIRPFIFRSIKKFIFYGLSFFGKHTIMFMWDYKRRKTGNLPYNLNKWF